MRIAIVALNAYPAIVPGEGTTIGGLETFAWSLACTLALNSNHSVSFVVRHTSPPKQQVVDGVQIHCVVERLRTTRLAVSQHVEFGQQFPWLKIKRFRPALLWQISLLALSKLAGPRTNLTQRIEQLLATARPDVILTLGIGDGSAAAVRAAKSVNVPAWLWWQSNSDLNENFQADGQYVDAYGVTSPDALACYEADGFISQTQWQQKRTTELFGRDSIIIPNPIDGARFFVGEATAAARQEILWIGRYDRIHKRPHLAIEIARLCPQIPFHFIINRGDPEVELQIRRSCPPNVRITDYIPRDEMPNVYRTARLFLSTGSNAFEGFPNVLLEAAASGTPIASLEDFDSFLERSQAGVSSAGDTTRLTDMIRQLWDMPAAWHQHSQSGSTYVRQHHTLAECVSKFHTAVTR